MSPPGVAGLSPGVGGISSETPLPRRTRKQVSRACDLCRARRIKCDSEQPCKTCRQRNAQCTYKGDDEPRTLSMALREIDKLKLRIKELEIENLKLKTSNPQTATIPSPDSADLEQSSLRTTGESPTGLPSPSSLASSPKPQWQGIHVATARSEQASYYGPASSFYFLRRIGGFLGKTLKQPLTDRSLQPRGPSTNTPLETGIVDDGEEASASPLAGHENRRPPVLSRTQEESLIKLFWEGYHCIFPVVDEVEFRKHYASLWVPDRPYRKHSALADIILALCLQYGYAFIPQHTTQASSGRHGPGDDASLAGRYYFLRSQSLLTASLESPTITTVQCYTFMIAYLCCASFHNMCHILVAQAIRTAEVLGLHLEPPADLPHGERELRKRIWWVLWTADVRTSAKHGRPMVVDWDQIAVTAASDDLEAASYHGAALGSYGDVTWLTYVPVIQNLHKAMIDIHNPLYFRYGEVISQHELSCIYNGPAALESCAKFLAPKLIAMKNWVDSVPRGLQIQRRNGGVPFSTDRSPLDIETLAPAWLQRQRASLELTFHNLMVNLTRPFISFYSHPDTYTPMAERQATTCVDHAIAYTLIMHQVMTESDTLSGWTEYFSIQWNVAITMVGFILAYPIHPATPRTRHALDKALVVFDTYGVTFGVSADAAAIIRDLIGKADLISRRFDYGVTSDVAVDNSLPVIPGTTPNNGMSEDDLAWLDPSRQVDQYQLNQLMDWAASVDSFNNFDRFFDANNPVDPWAFETS